MVILMKILRWLMEVIASSKSIERTQNHANDKKVEKALKITATKEQNKVINNIIKKESSKNTKIRISWPTEKRTDGRSKLTSPFGDRELKLPNGKTVKQFHNGCDYSTQTGGNDFLLAVDDMIVVEILTVDHSYPTRFIWDEKRKATVDGRETGAIPKNRAQTPWIFCRSLRNKDLTFLYMHLNPIYEDGQNIKVGDVIKVGKRCGIAGNYGFSLHEHLHFSIKLKGKLIDPEGWFRNMKEFIIE